MKLFHGLVFVMLLDSPLEAQLLTGNLTSIDEGKLERYYYDRFGCQPNCWETCLADLWNSEFYFFAHTLINEVRALRFSNPKSKGTVFILDSTASKEKFVYQQTLAAIASIVMPVEYNEWSPTRSCNPFFHAQYFEFGTASWADEPNWQCLDHCHAARGLLSMVYEYREDEDDLSADLLGGGCTLGRWVADSTSPKIPCANEKYSYNELAIAFTNHADQGSTNFIKYHCDQFPKSNKLQVIVDPGTFTPGFDASRWVHMGDEKLQSEASNLLKCMYKSCCRWPFFEVTKIEKEKSKVFFVPKLSESDMKKKIIPTEATAEEVMGGLHKSGGGASVQQPTPEDYLGKNDGIKRA